VANRNVFARSFQSVNSGGTDVWVLDGEGVSLSLPESQSYTAGETLIQGDFVYVSGTSVFKASALSGVAAFNYGVIGATTVAAPAGSGISVSTDGIVSIGNENVTADVSLVPGEFYYLSKYSGQITRYATASGLVSASGTNEYQVSVPVGFSVSNSELNVEIQPPVILYS
jgi:hypothetical protein